MRSILTTLLLLTSLPLAQDPEPKGAATAKLAGPKEKKTGQLVIIKATGTSGTDIKFDCAPKNVDWEVVKFQNGKDDLGIIFSTDTPGVYHFFVAASGKDGKIVTDVHEVTILAAMPGPPSPPTPPDAPDELVDVLSKAFGQDLTAGTGSIEHKKILSIIYNTAGKITCFDKNISKLPQIYDSMRLSAEKFLPKGTLPHVRKAIADFQKAVVKAGPDTILTDEIRAQFSKMFLYIQSALDAVGTAEMPKMKGKT